MCLQNRENIRGSDTSSILIKVSHLDMYGFDRLKTGWPVLTAIRGRISREDKGVY